MRNRAVGVQVKNLCGWLFTEKGDILHQLSEGSKEFIQISFKLYVCKSSKCVIFFQNFSDLEQTIFLKGSQKLFLSAGRGHM